LTEKREGYKFHKRKDGMILRGKLTENGRMITLHIERERISRIEHLPKRSRLDREDLNLYITPGFFDPQVNGFAGVDFNSKNLTLEDILRAGYALLTTGVTTFFPTLITTSSKRLIQQLKILREAIECDPLISKMCKGIHLEGPYISSSEGPRGIHPPQFIRPPQWDEFEKFQEACGERIKLITLAPEKEGAFDFIRKAVSNGVAVAIGHTEASEEILDRAYEAGARLSTHLGNGMGNKIPRYRNPFQKQLAMDGLMASIIADGIHLPDYVVKNIVRAKGPERLLLCTDAMAAATQPPGKYLLADLEVEVSEDGRTRWGETESLAGSTLTMPKAITNLMKFTGIDLGTAVKMANENGRKLFPGVIGTLATGQPANLVLFRFKGEMVIKKTFLMGEEISPISNFRF
jgi:N-acetylglucosamine-6-phosphate deacetylase